MHNQEWGPISQWAKRMQEYQQGLDAIYPPLGGLTPTNFKPPPEKWEPKPEDMLQRLFKAIQARWQRHRMDVDDYMTITGIYDRSRTYNDEYRYYNFQGQEAEVVQGDIWHVVVHELEKAFNGPSAGV